MKNGKHKLSKSLIIDDIPLACSSESAAVEFFERERWGDCPACVHCGSVSVYKMVDAKTGERNKRFLWRCHDCKRQYTVRIGAVYEESRVGLRHWVYAFWRAGTSKKGVAALEIKRHCQITYRAALFMMNRIRFALAPAPNAPMLTGTVECDEMYVGGKPRPGTGFHKRGRGTSKTPVFVAVERGGKLRRKVVVNVTGDTLKEAIRESVDPKASIITDENSAYRGIGSEYAGGHQSVCHSTREYSRNGINTNTAESSFALVKRGIMGVYHNVSKEYLHRYLWQFDFIWNNRDLNDGERTAAAIRAAEGKRLMYRTAAQKI
jgi:transposase-like protein